VLERRDNRYRFSGTVHFENEKQAELFLSVIGTARMLASTAVTIPPDLKAPAQEVLRNLTVARTKTRLVWAASLSAAHMVQLTLFAANQLGAWTRRIRRQR
jgi:hypothetical protein